MRTRAKAARAAWLSYLAVMRRYHRYEVVGLERLTAPGAALITGYHGRLFALDLCMMQGLLFEQTGMVLHAIVNRSAGLLPFHDWLAEGMEYVDGDGPDLTRAITRGEKLIVTPGGTREGCRSFRTRYRVDWGDRRGYLRLAVKHRLPILPVAASGVDDTYFGMFDGYAWAKRLGLSTASPPWLALGPLGPVPLSPPFPVKIVQHIGEPIDLFAGREPAPADPEWLSAAHARVVSAVQGLLDRAVSGQSRS